MEKQTNAEWVADIVNLHPQASLKIKQIQQAYDIDLIDDFKDICELNYLYHRRDNIYSEIDKTPLFSNPIKIGEGVVFYPWTIGSEAWIEEVVPHQISIAHKGLSGEETEEEKERIKRIQFVCEYATAFALSHSNQSDVFSNLITFDDTFKAILDWALKTNITQEELDEAIVKIYNLNKKNEEYVVQSAKERQQLQKKNKQKKAERTGSDIGWNPLIARLMKEFGQSREYWMWETAGDISIAQFNTWNYWEEQKYLAETKSSVKFDEDSPVAQAEADIVAHIKYIERNLIEKGKKK